MPIHSSSCRIFHDEWFKKSPGLYNAMGFNVMRMEGKCFIERGREISFLETELPKKTLHFAHIGASFSNLQKTNRKATELQCIHIRKWPKV